MTKTPTLLEKANYIEQIANKFNDSIDRNLANLQTGSRVKNEAILRSMIDPSMVDVEKVVKLICAKY
jgi:hypothetical protein